MPRYKVVARKNLGFNCRRQEVPNPFLIRDIFSPGLPKTTNLFREWEFDAKDEDEVKILFQEAKDMGIENVSGFELESIELINPELDKNTEVH